LSKDTYGPPSLNAYAKQVAEQKDWSWRKQPVPVSRKGVDALTAYMRDHVEHVPARERQVYQLHIEEGLSLPATAVALGVSFETAKTLMRRLRKRAA
jgi:DNA-directed RNA polymerase specialized sigma24 family protein